MQLSKLKYSDRYVRYTIDLSIDIDNSVEFERYMRQESSVLYYGIILCAKNRLYYILEFSSRECGYLFMLRYGHAMA
jgi:hypothetical protein